MCVMFSRDPPISIGGYIVKTYLLLFFQYRLMNIILYLHTTVRESIFLYIMEVMKLAPPIICHDLISIEDLYKKSLPTMFIISSSLYADRSIVDSRHVQESTIHEENIGRFLKVRKLRPTDYNPRQVKII